MTETHFFFLLQIKEFINLQIINILVICYYKNAI